MSTRNELVQYRSWGLGWMTTEKQFVQPPHDPLIDELLQKLLEEK